MDWYYREGSIEIGPVTADEILNLFAVERISHRTEVWQFGEAPVALGRTPEFDLPPPLPILPRQGPRGTDAVTLDPAWGDRLAHPWRRLFARSLDFTFVAVFLGFLIGFLMMILPMGQLEFLLATKIGALGLPAENIFKYLGLIDALLYSEICFLVAIPINAVILGLVGTTFGKWIFGICIVRPDGNPMGVLVALRREVLVYILGLGCGIPLVTLITRAYAYRTLTEHDVTPWDTRLRLVVTQRPNRARQWALSILGGAIVFAIEAGEISPWLFGPAVWLP